MTTTDPAAEVRNAPGWYPDPVTDGRSERWWTGEGWSGHSRPLAAVQPHPPAGPIARPRNGTARSALALGVLAMLVAALSLLGTAGVWISSLGVLAVVLGIRALRLHAAGEATAFVRAVVAIVLGSIATVLMLALWFLPDVVPAGGGSFSDTGVSTADGGTLVREPLEAIGPQRIPDDDLESYTAVPVDSISTVSAGCGTLNAQETFNDSTYARTRARERQDLISSELSTIRAVLTNSTATMATWPTAFDVDPDTGVIFTPAPSCEAVGTLPTGAELRVGASRDGSQMAFAMWDPTLKVGAVWRSVDDTEYAL
jgi:hypothetical protein